MEARMSESDIDPEDAELIEGAPEPTQWSDDEDEDENDAEGVEPRQEAVR
jgi:hypothetical protein